MSRGAEPATSTNRAKLLEVLQLEAWYGESHVLHGIGFDVAEGEVVSLLGRNGAGKSTTLKSIIGVMPKRKGSVRYHGTETIEFRPRAIAHLGIAYCPEERGIFSSLSVYENLVLPPVLKQGGMKTAEIYELFPNLAERRTSQGTKLSGGEQQMLAIGRILRTGAKLLLLDEPTEGLAPVIVKQIGHTLEILKKRGYTIVLVEQNLHFAIGAADRHFVIEQGRIVDMFASDQIESGREKLRAYLGA